MKKGQKIPEKVKAKKKQTAVGKQSQDAPMSNQGMLNANQEEVPEMARTSLAQLYNNLKNSKRGGLFTGSNSRFYTAVMSDLSDINTNMQKSFTKDTVENQKMLINMEHMYQKLIKSCNDYIARDPSTKAGIHRKELVTQIQAQASSDFVALDAVRTEFCSLSPEEQSTKGWNDLLDQARTVRLSVKNFSALGKAEGGQASEVYKLNGSNTNVRNADGNVAALSDTYFFKNEDEIDMTKETCAGKVVENILKRYPKLSKKEKGIIRKWANTMKTDISITDESIVRKLGDEVSSKLSSEGKEAVQSVVKVLKGTSTTLTNLVPALKLGDQEKINMSRRNVATSRVAALMGLGNLVANSQTAEIYDEASGQTFKGNLMEKAQGMSAAQFLKNEQKKGKENKSWTKTDIKVNVTGGFQRDMCNLQVLDVICGQSDRHHNNFFVSTNEAGELAGLQGIDNDGAFGLNEEVSSAKDANRHDRGIYDMDTGEMTIPYMDKNLAERILQIEPDMFRFALQDLLKKEEIEAVIKRLERTKDAILKTKQTEPNRLLKDDEWNDDTAQDMINQAWDMKGKYLNPEEYYPADSKEENKGSQAKTLAQQNYFGRLMNSMRLTSFSDAFVQHGSAPQLERRKKRA